MKIVDNDNKRFEINNQSLSDERFSALFLYKVIFLTISILVAHYRVVDNFNLLQTKETFLQDFPTILN